MSGVNPVAWGCNCSAAAGVVLPSAGLSDSPDAQITASSRMSGQRRTGERGMDGPFLWVRYAGGGAGD
ncbi:MAG: hypothetical protein OHK0022_13100 [Roseiflexaceae bacterium]